MNRALQRLADILDAISQIDALLIDKSYASISKDRVARAALERFLEIISEASRHVPDELKHESLHIPWRRVADIGNYLRHAYHRVDMEALWAIHAEGHLADMQIAIEAWLKNHKLP